MHVTLTRQSPTWFSGFFNGFPLISTDFYEFSRFSTDFPRIPTDFLGFFTDFKQISAVFSSLQLNYIVQKMLGEKNNMPLYTKYIVLKQQRSLNRGTSSTFHMSSHLLYLFHHSSPTNFFSQPNGKWFNSRKIKNYGNLSRPFSSKINYLQNCQDKNP